jgi:hypothetical protein
LTSEEGLSSSQNKKQAALFEGAARHVHSVKIAISESKRKVLQASDSKRPLPGVQPVQ